MIYDGPFSDSTVNKKIKNLNDEKVDKETAKQKLVDIFKKRKLNEHVRMGKK